MAAALITGSVAMAGAVSSYADEIMISSEAETVSVIEYDYMNNRHPVLTQEESSEAEVSTAISQSEAEEKAIAEAAKNGLAADVKCYTERAVDKHPKIW